MANRLRWLGHAAWQLTTAKGKVFLIDPWLSGNPAAPVTIDELRKADYILLTHDHPHHASDVPAVVRRTGAVLVGQPETSERYHREGVPEHKLLPGGGMNIGGSVVLGGVTVTMVDACHTSETGRPAGYILALEDGTVLYVAGDTSVHANMRTWGRLFDIDIALLPIGGRFTMDGRQAAHALRLLGAKAAIPYHYRTSPLLAGSAQEFVRHTKEQAPGARLHVLDIGDTFIF